MVRNENKDIKLVFISQDIIEKGSIKLLEGLDFSGSKGSVIELYNQDSYQTTIVCGLGNDNELDDYSLIKIAENIYSKLPESKKLFLEIHSNFDNKLAIKQIILGLRLKSWSFDKYISDEENKSQCKINEIEVVNNSEVDLSHINSLVDGITFARELINEPANKLYPKIYVDRILELQALGLEVTIFNKDTLKEIGMESLLSVSQGSDKEPYVAVIKHNANANQSKPLVFVGKGVTFDTGGYSLKPSLGMMTMKKDMAGSATVVGLMKTLALRKAKVNAIGIVGLVENSVNGSATKPGDVVNSLSSQTIEVLNTDAEGRLVLADLLWYAQREFNPEFIIDIATLTGAIIISLGVERAGLFSNNSTLTEHLEKSGNNTGELVWSLPLEKRYAKYLKSPVADLQNISTEMKGGGSIFAAMFLEKFVNGVNWAHLDIAGVSSVLSHKKNDSEFGIRLLDRMISDYYEK